MERETRIGIRVSFEWAIGGGCAIALIAGKGTLERLSIWALAIIGAAAVSVAIVEHGWFKTSAYKRAGSIFLAWIVMALLAYVAWPNDKPHLVIQSVDPQFLPQQMKVGDKVNVMIYYKNDGGTKASLRFANNMTFYDHLSSNPTIREKQETNAITLAKQALNDPNTPITPLTLDAGESLSGFYPGIQVNEETLRDKVLFMAGVYEYLGRSDLPDVEYCYFFELKDNPLNIRPQKCANHNTE